MKSSEEQKLYSTEIFNN